MTGGNNSERAGQRPDLPHGEGALYPPRGLGDDLVLWRTVVVEDWSGPQGPGPHPPASRAGVGVAGYIKTIKICTLML